jgi:hypothetical protein
VRRLRDDLSLLGSVATLCMAAAAIVAWVLSWPSAVVPTALFVLGIVVQIVAYAADVLARIRSVPVWLRVPIGVSHATLCSAVSITLLAHPLLARIVGAISLVTLVVTAVTLLAPRLAARYGLRRDRPAR